MLVARRVLGTKKTQPMKLLNEKTEDEEEEKHAPIIERTETGIRVRVSSVLHPMEEGHFIEWVEAIGDGRIYRKFLKPGDKPKAEFNIKAEKIEVREYCSIHGLWKS